MTSLEGGALHKELMTKVADYLNKQGYTTELNAILKPTRFHIDVLGIKNTEKVGVECQSILPKNTFKHKETKYKPFLTFLLYAFPMDANQVSKRRKPYSTHKNN